MSTATATRNSTNGRRQQLVDASGNPVPSTNGRWKQQPQKREPVKPIDEVRIGRVKAAIWQNTVETDDGSFIRYGVTLEKLYLNRDGQWRGTGSFGKDDLLLLAKVAEQAFERINDMQMERPV